MTSVARLHVPSVCFSLFLISLSVLQAIVGKGDHVWDKEHVEALRQICPMLGGGCLGGASTAEIEGYGSSKLTVESAVKYLQLANNLFVQAELFHFCAGTFSTLSRVLNASDYTSVPNLVRVPTRIVSLNAFLLLSE